MELSIKHKVYLTSAIVGIAGGITYILNKSKHRLRNADEKFDYLKIETVQTEASCDKVVCELRRRCTQHNALGFDCEWVTEKRGTRRPVAFIQLSSYDGYCGLFKLNAMESFPLSLKNLLEDETVIKVGVAPEEDSQKLRHDYAVVTKSTLDLRYLAQCCDYEPGGLAALAKTVLGVVMDKSWKVRCSDWEADQLTDRQAHYAATDAHVAIKIYAVLLEKLRRKNTWFNWYSNWNPTEFCSTYMNRKYKVKHNVTAKTKTNDKKKSSKENATSKRYLNAMRSKPLYHNCYLEAPDGELLCTCNYDKPMWYVERQLADVVSEDPLTVRLRFEPSGRSVGDVGRFYQLQKENRCVVCGSTNSYIRKNVVPREYRKLFPEIMKEHSSHDVVLLCGPCHQLSNIKDQAIREKLATLCSAPYIKRFNEDGSVKKIRSAARALHHYNGKYDIPDVRRKELEEVILNYYTDHDNVTEELLKEACKLQVTSENSDYESHGLKVIDYFLAQGSLLRLEEVWRQHFLDSMEPKYMPELWSIRHNEERLRVKWQEGRLSPEALKSIGLARL